MQDIGKMTLKVHDAAFEARFQFSYWVGGGEEKLTYDDSGIIPDGNSRTRDPGKFGVPDGAEVSMYVDVIDGNKKTAKEKFTYRQGNSVDAHYTISGASHTNHLHLDHVR